jgi:ATP/maltotriose-dependent transcriptional regulator MalT
LSALDAADAISVVLRSGVPGSPTAKRVHIDRVLSAGWPPPAQTDRSQGARLAAALAWSLGRAGRSQEALAIADRQAMPLLTAAADRSGSLEQSECYAALAETYLLHGHLPQAAACSQFATDYADSHDPVRFRALALRAAAEALNGEFAAAGAALGSAQDVDQGQGWLRTSWPITIAITQICFRGGDTDEAIRAIDSLSIAASDPIERTVVRLGRAWVASAAGDHKAVLAGVDSLTRAVDAQHLPAFLLDLAVSIKSMALAHLGQPGAVLKLVGHRASPPGHPVCFEVQAASAHLQLAAPRKALATTERCMTCPNHSLRTFPSVLLRRAVAHELLDHHDLADADFSRATRLAVELAGIRPALGLPIDVLERLYYRLLDNEPDMRAVLTAQIPATAEYTTPDPISFDLGALSDREQVLAAWLGTDLTMQAIADELCVSTNTVKTQAKSLYRKLGVSSRQDAVDKLERAGLSPSGPRQTPSG